MILLSRWAASFWSRVLHALVLRSVDRVTQRKGGSCESNNVGVGAPISLVMV